ncbi:MAG: hypothetical protein ACK56I_00315, partial [bacterium]
SRCRPTGCPAGCRCQGSLRMKPPRQRRCGSTTCTSASREPIAGSRLGCLSSSDTWQLWI